MGHTQLLDVRECVCTEKLVTLLLKARALPKLCGNDAWLIRNFQKAFENKKKIWLKLDKYPALKSVQFLSFLGI